MLAIVTPTDLDAVLEVCARWEVRASVIGTVTGTGRLRVFDRPHGAVLADVPAAALEEDKPIYDRPRARPDTQDALLAADPTALDAPQDVGDDLCRLLADPAWIYRQYDQQLWLNTVVAPGGDAAVLRLKAPGLPPSTRALALSADGNARWSALDPRAGAAMSVAEACLNVACAGARPVALVNCLNFGNPEHPEVMWQLSEAVDGIADACNALGVPVIGGNVSLYNESRGRDIDPSPIVAVLGLIDRLERRPPGVRLVDGGLLLLLGSTEPNLSGSLWAARCRDHRGGRLPALDLGQHARLVTLVQDLVTADLLAGLHDVADGGLGVALVEMALHASLGWWVAGPATHVELFAESPSRVVVCVVDTAAAHAVRARAEQAGIAVGDLGRVGGDRLVVDGLLDLPLATAAAAWHDAIPAALAS
jgi:phosphoribosylformylglycinamidine synthase